MKRFIKKLFEPVIYASGSEILKVILWFQWIGLIYLVIGTASYRIHQFLYETHTSTVMTCMRWILNFHVIITRPSLVYCIWKGRKMRSQKHLQFYMVIESVLLLPIFFLTLYSKNSIFSDKPITLVMISDVILHCIVFFVIFLGIILVGYCCRKLGSPLMMQLYEHCSVLKELGNCDKQDQKSVSVQNVPSVLLENVSVLQIHHDVFYKHIITPWDVTIDSSSKIGEGQFGFVYSGKLLIRNEKLSIAAKVAKSPSDSDTFHMLIQEIKIMIHVGCHPNIVKFYGVTSDASINEHFAIITELCDLGSLDRFLRENRHTFINLLAGSTNSIDKIVYINLEEHGTHSTKDLIIFATDIAKGMEHLAKKLICHCDLSTRNVLLDSKLNVKLSDFGMSRRLYNYQTYSRLKDKEALIPWRWMPIEAIEDLKFSQASDVYSFGVTLWEIFSLGEVPFQDLVFDETTTDKFRYHGLRLQKPHFADNQIYEIMNGCWKIDPRQRPKFNELRRVLETLLNIYQEK